MAILQAQLAHGMGLDGYAIIMKGDPATDEFQRLFNGYYRVRRNEAWRKAFYNLFQRAKNEGFSFDRIIKELYQQTGNIEASFSSKMLATIDPSKPIWDQYVLQNLGLKLTGKTQTEKLRNAIALYWQIDRWYQDYLALASAQETINTFDQMLPDCAWLNPVKKIDCLLWSKRE